MEDTNTLDKGEEYGEMGASLVTGGFPIEAKQILERGMAANVFQGDAKARAQGDLDRARSGAAVDMKDLPNADKQLGAAKNANEMIGVGKLYFSAGEYGKAADAIQKGLTKGGATDVDDANLLLGVARARAGNNAEAAAAFAAVKNPAITEVARLWKLKLDTANAPPAPEPAAPEPVAPAGG
jgi:TolA-binding protein